MRYYFRLPGWAGVYSAVAGTPAEALRKVNPYLPQQQSALQSAARFAKMGVASEQQWYLRIAKMHGEAAKAFDRAARAIPVGKLASKARVKSLTGAKP